MGRDLTTISATDLKTRGVGAIHNALQVNDQLSVTVRGVVRYVVMSEEQYRYLRRCELEAALAESTADLNAGRFVKETVARHVRRIASLNKTAG
ncbi:MAG: hypothetical protein JWR22_1252 [Herminiimonas sp.]|nr:hypothetical protein [Herminiimonas sp.]